MENPFDDIVPRITAAEKRVQQRAREEAQQEREEAERRKGAKKCVCAYLFRSASEFHFFSRTAETSSFWALVMMTGQQKRPSPRHLKREELFDQTVRSINFRWYKLTYVGYSVIDNHDQVMPDMLAPLKRVHNKSDEPLSASTTEAKACHRQW